MYDNLLLCMIIMQIVERSDRASQFTASLLSRDIVKPWLCFGACREGAGTISSVNWGCGIFGGNRFLKFIQQVGMRGCQYR